MKLWRVVRRSITGWVGLWFIMLMALYIYLMNGPVPWGASKPQSLPIHLATMPEELDPVHPLDRMESLNLLPPIEIPNMVKSSARVAEYCNHPSNGVRGQEGEVQGHYKLVSVHITIRHGDRTSMYSFPKHSNPYIPCTISKDSLSFHPKTRSFIPTMTAYNGKQHPRSGFKNWALFPNRKLCRSAELTGQGALQHLLLGDHLNKKYIHKWQLFGGNFTPDKILLTATEYSRTYQSAIAFLYGFLPHFNLTELNIHRSNSMYFCDSQYANMACTCPMVYTLKQKAAKQTGLKKNSQNFKELMNHIADVYDLKKSELLWDSAMMDIFMGQSCHGISLMCNKEGSCINQDTLEKIWDHLDDKMEEDGSDPNKAREDMSRLSMHPLLTEMFNRMKNISQGVESPRFILYSGHDTTVAPLAHVLGIYNGRWPPYATRIVIEQYARTRDNVVQHYFRVLYNGKDVTRQVRFCKDIQKDGLCRLKYFEDFVKEGNLNDLQMNSYEEACQL